MKKSLENIGQLPFITKVNTLKYCQLLSKSNFENRNK
jgi:hypothetical protein